MKFYNYLKDDVRFARGRDWDYPSRKSKSYIIWNPKDVYKKQLKTHDLTSHAIKHLKEFDPKFLFKVLDDIIRYIENTDYIIVDGGKVTNNSVLNTLDRIHDKRYEKIPLTTEEEKISEWIEEIKNQYNQIIEDLINKAEEIDIRDGLPESGVVSYKKETSRGLDKIILDLDNFVIVVMEPNGKIKTVFRKKSKETFQKYIQTNNII